MTFAWRHGTRGLQSSGRVASPCNRKIACNCERSFIRVRDSAKNSSEVTGGIPTANSGENRDHFLRASNSRTFRMRNVIVHEINSAYWTFVIMVIIYSVHVPIKLLNISTQL